MHELLLFCNHVGASNAFIDIGHSKSVFKRLAVHFIMLGVGNDGVDSYAHCPTIIPFWFKMLK